MKQQQFEERKKNREAHLAESLQKFNEDHAEEIEAYNKYQEEQKAKAAQEYGEEQASEGEGDENEAEPPELPKFNEEEAAEKFDEENPEVLIPEEIVDDIDNDWALTEEENEALMAKYMAGREEN